MGGDSAELGMGPGSYDIDQSVWHVNVSNPGCLSRTLADNVVVLQP